MRSHLALLGLLAALLPSCSPSDEPIRVGAIYPTGGSQGPGGLAESRGVKLAAEMVNASGGVNGRRIDIHELDVPGADGARSAVASLAGDGIRIVLGSYGSTISRPAADEAARRGMVFWETGAVGEMTGTGAGELVFRVSPTGAVLGRQAVSFIAEKVAPMHGRSARSLRFAVANVDDVYGRSVAEGAVDEIKKRRLSFAGAFAYDAHSFDAAAVVRKIAAAKPDVLFVSAYLEDGVRLREETLRQRVPLVASIGTSSSYCMLEFGKRLGAKALGLFASDKPDAGLNPSGLEAEARALLEKANALFEARHGEEMDPPALAGFSAAWALFRHVMPRAAHLSAGGVAEAARSIRIPLGGLPNGSGIEFAASGSIDAGANVRAVSVIWEWVADVRRAVVWPPRFATAPVEAIPISA